MLVDSDVLIWHLRGLPAAGDAAAGSFATADNFYGDVP